MYGTTGVTAVTLAIGGNGSKIAHFAHITAHGAPAFYVDFAVSNDSLH